MTLTGTEVLTFTRFWVSGMRPGDPLHRTGVQLTCMAIKLYAYAFT